MKLNNSIKYSQEIINNLNNDIKKYFSFLFPIEKSYKTSFSSISRMVMLDRYAQKDKSLKSLKINDLVIIVIKEDPIFPSRGIGNIFKKINKNEYLVKVEEEYWNLIDNNKLVENDQNLKLIKVNKRFIDKPLEIYYEQIAKRVSSCLAKEDKAYESDFFNQLKDLNIVPAGRVLYGAGSDSDVTFFNCFVMPMIRDSREGLSNHRKEVMEIMSHGGGVGTNGSTLRPKGAIAKSVGGKSSGAVSWLNDLATLTHLVQQGGSRRGAQMIMMADWHPDVIEFIISKMQNPKILKFLKDSAKDPQIKEQAQNKISLIPIKNSEVELYRYLKKSDFKNDEVISELESKIQNGGIWKVNNKNFLTGANISINISDNFMKAVKEDKIWDLKFPDVENYNKEQKLGYDKNWHKIGDIWEWEKLGYPIKTYRSIRAKDLWDLINICANYSAEPGIFFIDRANQMTNAKSYNMKVVATNPCGEQPLAPYSVCNLAAINLANFVDKNDKQIQWDKLKKTIQVCVRMQDNVIDATNYFLEKNTKQALGERRIGLGVMGLHDLLIWLGIRYGSEKSLKTIDKLFKFIATNAYLASSAIGKEKGSFPFLKNNYAKFLETGYMKKMPEIVRDRIRKNGIRNSHLLTIAPTGSTGTMVGISTGLEPYFAFEYFRSGRLGKNIKVNANIVNEWLKYNPDYKNQNLPNIFVSAMELKPEEHINIQCVIQRWVDSSISKTVNAPKGYSVKQVEKIYETLYENGAKGGTVYVDGSRESQVLSLEDSSNFNEQIDITSLEKENSKKILEIDSIGTISKEAAKKAFYRGIKQDRNFGFKIGDLCPLCKEGTMVDLGGCSTCNNCSSQLKCSL